MFSCGCMYVILWISGCCCIYHSNNLYYMLIRFMHERLRTHAESIAFFGGGAREKAVRYLNSLLYLKHLDANCCFHHWWCWLKISLWKSRPKSWVYLIFLWVSNWKFEYNLMLISHNYSLHFICLGWNPNKINSFL